MMTAWTRTMVLGLLLCPLGCVISVGDGDGDDFGNGGTFGSSGSGGDSGSGGTAAAGSGGSAGLGGSGGGDPFPAPTCDPEPRDDADECVQCLKRSCCDEWLACDDEACVYEFFSVSECAQEDEFAGPEELGMCISESSSTGDGFVQMNTQGLIDCALTSADDAGLETLCSSECFGNDIFLF